jgi:hypothetical protein
MNREPMLRVPSYLKGLVETGARADARVQRYLAVLRMSVAGSGRLRQRCTPATRSSLNTTPSSSPLNPAYPRAERRVTRFAAWPAAEKSSGSSRARERTA